MIRCNNCGTINPDTVTNCQNCNALLPTPVGKGENGGSSRSGAQDSPALPAWLESLRAGDRPNVEPKSFSLEDMGEEGMVPSWMQPNRPQDERNSNQYPTMRPAASPAPNTDENYAQARNISANSLIDANALPPWMQPEKSQMPQQNIAASSLVQPELMPDWMKTMQPSSPAPQQPSVQQPPLSAQGFSAHQLIDQQSLPNWMLQEGSQLFTPPAQAPSNGAHQPGNPSTGQPGFSASSLLDMNALPSWMRESENRSQEQRVPQQQAWQAPQQPQRGYEQPQAWQMPQQHPSIPASNASGPSGAGTLSMGSLIDVNALPEWLRSAADTPQSQQGQQGPNTSANYTFPPRADNVRVPNRPRNESGMSEDSEVAANVFSSMLGVASNAPQYPAQAPQQPQQVSYPAYQGAQPMSNSSTALPPQGMPNPQGYNPQGYNSQAYASGQLGQQNMGQQNYGYPMQSGQGNYYTGMGQQNMALQNQLPQQSEKPAKKVGLFEAIRNFFFRQ